MCRVDLRARRIVLGVGGGIAAYKSVILARELLRRGASLEVILTASAQRFVGALTFTGLTGKPPIVDLWDSRHAGEIHVELGEWAELVVIAPATANLITRAAHGHADDALAATLLCFDGPVLFAPAMHSKMWDHPATRENVALLRERGARFVGPVEGVLASGEQGIGRLSEPPEIAGAIAGILASSRDLADKKLLISAGPTHEDLDPVRFLGNRSSGKMGYALAERAAARGAKVTLVSGPVTLPAPPGVALVRVRSAIEMQAAIDGRRDLQDAIIMAAAVADYRPDERADHKIKKSDAPQTLTLVRNPDILAGLGAWRTGARPVLVGFAVETSDPVGYARGKLLRKKVDLVVANHASDSFGKETNIVTLVDAEHAEPLPELDKHAVADRVLDRVARLLSP
ncbi:MAG: bifunctional phosphopantothenoylcysteine decarboxylase/phosphopantothenate--cysteine ligase CoaBC [Sandaracinaceae bacterium]|nr:bifunctional phosphopantothenoylcysteine decarboxylase/phosphopantothenate--cysteine ligase CoaBC [Sandaracinaceae bacterium]